ncbi:hypothetical protein PT974_09335 [Cladobotryum mycophilum]|uniref:RRM domain-containing protein n=1 Tax=Cladobotryum mycophilum TaxID=491253 RepID=A0ABR0SFV4_9HYPO
MAEIARMNLQPAPHPILDAVKFPKVHAEHRPPSDRAAFTRYYPNGLPVVYKMMNEPNSDGVVQNYVEDNLPVGFYTNPPPNAMAVFSTIHGERPFRKMEHILPQRRIHLWSGNEIQSVCNSIRKAFWNDMKNMRQPYCWDDLWTYFDAYDLYTYGTLNLWNAINTLFDENRIIADDVAKETAAHIGHWADEWLEKEENRKRLTQWNDSHGPIFLILSPKDRETLGTIQDEVIPLIASALKGRRAWLLSNKKEQKPEVPNDLMSACRNNNVENWLAGQPIFNNSGLPSPPSSEPHRVSPRLASALAPCFVHKGHYYYLLSNVPRPTERPTERRKQATSQIVQELQKSAAAATTKRQPEALKVIIANGSSILPSSSVSVSVANEERPAEHQSASEIQEPAPQEISVDLPHPKKQSKRETGVGQHVPEDRVSTISIKSSPSSELPTLSMGTQASPDNMPLETDVAIQPTCAQPATLIVTQPQPGTGSASVIPISTRYPTKREVGTATSQGSRPRIVDNDAKLAGDEPLLGKQNASQDIGQSDNLNTAPRNQTAKQQPPMERKLPSQTGALARTESNMPGKNGPQSATNQPAQQPFYMQPDEGILQRRMKANIIVAHQNEGASGSSEQLPQPQASFRSYSGGKPTAPPLPFPIPAPPHTAVPIMPHGNRIQSNERKWVSGDNPRVESSNSQPQTPSRAGNRRNKDIVGNRRASQGQKSGNHMPSQQTDAQISQGEHTSWKSRRNNNSVSQPDMHQNVCRNPMSAQFEYVPCSCSQCNERNRSIWVRVESEIPQRKVREIQTRLKFGLGNRFGGVQEVCQVASTSGNAFVVRFVNESSVPEALCFGKGIIPERDLKITISPVFRSKWLNTTWPQVDKNRAMSIEKQQQPRAFQALPNFSFPVAAPFISPQMVPGHPVAPVFGHPALHHPLPGVPLVRGVLSQQQSPPGPHVPPPGFVRPGVIFPTHIAYPMKPAPIDPQAPKEDPKKTEVTAVTPHKRNHGENAEIVKDAYSQSKLPFEEALSDDSGIDNVAMATPKTNDSKSSATAKARVLLPSPTSREKGSPAKGDARDSQKDKVVVTEEPHAATEKLEDIAQMPSSGSLSETVKNKEAAEKAVVQGGGKHGPSISGCQVQAKEVALLEERTASLPTKPSGKPIPESSRQVSHVRVSSKFTEEEIRGRKQAWGRIPMPLDPRKSKKPVAAIVTNSCPKVRNLGEPSNGDAAEGDAAKVATPAQEIDEGIQNQHLDTKPDPAKRLGEANTKTSKTAKKIQSALSPRPSREASQL